MRQPDVEAASPSPNGGSLYAILESTHDAFVSIDAAGRVIGWNRAAEETFGWSRGEALGRLMAELIVPERFRDAHRRGLQRYLAAGEARVSGQRLELSALHRDGHELEVELTISPMRVGDATVFNAFLRDITARREAEREVRRLAAIVETSEDAIVSGSLDGTVATWNAGAERLYGYTAEEMVGQPITRLLPSGDFSEVLELRERLFSGKRVPQARRLVRVEAPVRVRRSRLHRRARPLRQADPGHHRPQGGRGGAAALLRPP